LAKLKAAETADALSEEDKARIAESIRLVEHGYEYDENGDVLEKIAVDIPPAGLPANADAGKLAFKTASRYEELLEYFAKWIGENTPIEDVSSRRLSVAVPARMQSERFTRS
jgi:hypothetical protein